MRIDLGREANHFWGHIDPDDALEVCCQRLAEPTHAAAEIQRRLAMHIDSERSQLVHQERHFPPACLEEATEIPASARL